MVGWPDLLKAVRQWAMIKEVRRRSLLPRLPINQVGQLFSALLDQSKKMASPITDDADNIQSVISSTALSAAVSPLSKLMPSI